jgi:hypothetical protein
MKLITMRRGMAAQGGTNPLNPREEVINAKGVREEERIKPPDNPPGSVMPKGQKKSSIFRQLWNTRFEAF